MIVSVRPIDDPPAFAARASGCPPEATMELRQVRVLDAHKMKLRLRGKHRPRGFVMTFEAKTLRETCEALTQELGDNVACWRWGNIHQLGMRHSLGLIKLLRPMLSVGPFPSPGDGTTINVGFYRHSNPYEHTIGASLRYIIDVKDSQPSGFILPSGQSGHIFSPHLKDQTELWRNGRRISLARVGPETRWESCLVLEPARSVA